MKMSDRDYYAARLKAELAAAAAASDDQARRAHEKLADQYRRLLEEGGTAEAAE
jgi:hypothetical protein